ncbi:SWIM zinc finger family protein [Motilimonas cestriensis]|uniref:SWIM zinc finger family protein n=1 Tax=Motilimonas cestriensis TaxID=2742685 RepID=UPI003DA1E796
MQVNYRYMGTSQVASNSQHTQVSFSPDTLRPPTFFVGELKNKLAFREAMSALHQVVISDMRFTPKNRDEYQRWLTEQEQTLLADLVSKQGKVKQQLNQVRDELAAMNRVASKIMAPFYQAQNQYFKYLYKHDIDAWYVLDPVITVHPDQVFFECFSEDESSYGKLSCSYEVFKNISDTEFGTTNIDYSEGLYNEFQKIRDYRDTQLKIDPDGFKVATSGQQDFAEKKIDLPDSWVRGFLQVSSAMTLPMVRLKMQPMDLYNICFKLRTKKERVGPRAMRFELTPGQAIKVILEPWGEEILCPRSIYQGDEPRSIRVWGRRRLHILERLLPIASHFEVCLLGDGMPSFYIADLGGMSFTLGLSGWSANDWSKMANFDLLASRAEVDSQTSAKVYQALFESQQQSANRLALQLGLDLNTVKSALAQYSQHGQVLYDMELDVYRIRHLCHEPIPLEQLRFNNEREEKALNFVNAGLVSIQKDQFNENGRYIAGQVLDNAVEHQSFISLDLDHRLVDGQCNCHFWHRNKLRQGPCEHMLALRQQTSNGSL